MRIEKNQNTRQAIQTLTGDEIILQLAKDIPAKPEVNWLRALHYNIHLPNLAQPIGKIDFRIGYTETIILYGGNIGYSVNEEHRGHHYAGKACKLLFRIAKDFGMKDIYITCNPDNWASRRTCEWLGAEFLENVDLPPDSDQRLRGDRQKCRYRVTLEQEIR